MNLSELLDYTGALLEVDRYRDYCPNGLQVEGKQTIRSIATGVTASLELVEAAAAAGADMLLCHHGYFWKGESPALTGSKYRRVAALIEAQMSLVAYHLPLDAHPELGNNAQLARLLGLEAEGCFGDQKIAWQGRLKEPMATDAFCGRIALALGRAPLFLGEHRPRVERIAWVSGGGASYFEEAAARGAEVFVTGEPAEYAYHLARETGAAFIAAGHHATERYGVQALGEHLSKNFGLQHHYIEIANPV